MINFPYRRMSPPTVSRAETEPRSVPGWVYDDGGRTEAGFRGRAGDCVARSIAIAAQLPYGDVYRRLADGNATQRRTKRSSRSSGQRTASHGIQTTRLWFQRYMQALGFAWVPTMRIGTGCTVHLRGEELPSGRLVVAVSRHYVAMIDGVTHDTHDPSRGGTRCVYGYWRQTAP